MTHVIFARKDFAASHPDQVGRFVKGFFTALHLAKSDRAKTIAFMAPLLNEPPQVLGQVYDHELGMLSDDGHFDPKALAVLKQSFVDMGILETQPSDDELLTTRFVPVKP
jgi:ABC-type nitrate/sulfonate/bicarbonate transport system substrate-binding protein